MVDNPHPIERTGADPVTPNVVRNRANEVFGGIDLNTPGNTQIGIGVITVGRIPQNRGYFAEARVHGILVASIANEGDTEAIYFTGEEPGGSRVSVQLVKTVEAETVDIRRKTMRHVTGNLYEMDEQIKSPSERAKIARGVGIKV